MFDDELEQLESAEKEREQDIAKLAYAYRQVFDTEYGKTVIMDLLQQCKVFSSTMTGNSWTYFNEGSRKVGLYILGMIDIPGFERINVSKNKK